MQKNVIFLHLLKVINVIYIIPKFSDLNHKNTINCTEYSKYFQNWYTCNINFYMILGL